jgi:hypothetical protein
VTYVSASSAAIGLSLVPTIGPPLGSTDQSAREKDSFVITRRCTRVGPTVPERGPSTVAKRLARHFAFGRSRVLTPVPADLVWIFFQRFPHIMTSWYEHGSHITNKADAGSVSTSQYLSPSFRTVPIPNLPVSMPEKALESLNGPAPLRGGMKDVSFPFFHPKEESPPLLLRITDAGAGSSSKNLKSKNHIY